MLKHLRKNKYLKYFLTGLALAGAVLLFFIFIILRTEAAPANPSSLQQYGPSTSTAIANGAWTTKSTVNLQATSSDASYPFLVYYQLILSGSSFTTATTVPATFCNTGSAYSSCGNNIWSTATTTAGWFNKSYKYRAPIVIQKGQVAGALTNFPIYLDLARLGTTNPFWSHTKKNSDGGDILITNSAGARLPLEVVSVSTSSKTGEVWFRSDSISSSSNITFYMYYGSSTATKVASTTTYGARNVWSDNFVSVFHMNQSPAGTGPQMLDSANGYNGTSSGSMLAGQLVACKLGNCLQFNSASNQFINLPFTKYSLATITASVWVKNQSVTPLANVYSYFAHGRDTNANCFWLNAQTTGAINYRSGTNSLAGSSITDNTYWYALAMTSVGTKLAGYFNGSANGTTTGNHTTTLDPDATRIGMLGYQTYYPANAYIDEVQISKIARTAKWIKTAYNNQNVPGTFYSTSTPEQYYLTNNKKAVKIISLPDSTSPAGYKWQSLACNSQAVCSKNWTIFNATVPNFMVDANPPSTPNPLTKIATTTTTEKLGFPAAVTEINFSQYKIYYHIGTTTQIHETDQLWGSTSDANLKVKNFNLKTSTTVTNLTPGKAYSFSLWAYDLAGNKSSSTYVWSKTMPGFHPSGQITSLVFDSTQSSSYGPAYNSIMWLGSLNGGNGRVRFQLASSDNTTGPWNYFGSSDGGVTCNSASWYDPGAPNTPIEISCAPANNNGHRYFRYLVQLCSNSDCTSIGSITPTVNNIIVNWSP